MKKLQILVADDHELVRRGLVALINGHANWAICGEANNGNDAIAKAKELRPDIAILDIGMPVLNGFEATRYILRDNPEVKVLILTLNDSDEVLRPVLNAGARGFLLKSDAARDLIAAVEALQHNGSFFSARAAEMVLAGYLGKPHASPNQGRALEALTAREGEILQLVAEGKSSKEVACHLNLTVKTAETRRSNIMRKLGLHSIAELVVYAVRNNIIQVPPGPPTASADTTKAKALPDAQTVSF